MSLPSPNLDDRTWKDIVDEAKKLIPSLCPQWTDFNTSDPGITLMELMAWMTEMILYRLNRVPDKNYIKFMELIGIDLTPPKPAETWLTFTPVEGAEDDLLPVIPANTRVSGIDSDNETITFETIEDLNLTTSRLMKIFTQRGEVYTDHTPEIVGKETSSDRFNLFEGKDEIPHLFYLGDPEIERVGTDFSLRIFVTLDRPAAGLDIQWSCWSGAQWTAVAPSIDQTSQFGKDGEILFTHLPRIMEKKIQGYSSLWLRLRLKSYRGGPLPRIKELKKCLELKKEKGVPPDTGYLSSEDIPFFPITFQGIVMPFGREGKVNDSLYFSSEVFAMPGVPVSIDIGLTDSFTPGDYDSLHELKVYWEYYAQSGEWELLGMTSPAGVSDSRWAFIDRTEAFTHDGIVSFSVPEDISPLELYGEVRNWVRVRIVEGSYNVKKKKNPPVCKRFLMRYTEKATNFEHYLSFNEFTYTYLTPEVLLGQPFEPFIATGYDKPELYLGFDSPFSNKLHRLYLRMIRRGKTGSNVTWEYPTEDGWKTLHPVTDETNHFTRRGLVEFIAPADWVTFQKFGAWAYWLRVRWNKFRDDRPPLLRTILTNAVKAFNAVSYKNEILGSCNGEPFQQFRFIHKPILPGPRVIVRELQSTIEQELKLFRERTREEIVEETDPHTGQVIALWVVWVEQENFYYSKRDSRHYILDIYNGTVTFGDGIKGRIPPIATENIKCEIYFTGGGKKGNMGKNTLITLETAFPFINMVTNPFPASGGTDMETLEEAKLRAPWTLKHFSRAVTAGDFEQLAREATGEVARAICLGETEGVANLIILPGGGHEKLEPSDALIETVKRYLEERRLLTSRIDVTGPGYVDFSIGAVVVLDKHKADQTTRIRHQIEKKLRDFFHPLTGGLYGEGWPMGRAVHLSELFYLIENVPGVDYINMLMLDRVPGKKRIDIGKTSFPYLASIDIAFSGE